EMENAINTLDSKITEYLVLISHETLNDHDSNDYLANMKTIKDFERIGDHGLNIAVAFDEIKDDLTEMA
ncbi:PhoU domain-containing protein, partial [Mediterraneibacter gnavus]|uniref:PhoU domain-containing protein n=1 Tax=Mediterraneibacter gnavus TaxID=33038 RepID=UPI00299F8275